MSEHSYQDYDEVLPEEPNGELVQWMDPRPLTFSPSGVALAAAGAFALGLATALIAVGVTRMAANQGRLPETGPLRRLS